MEREQNTNTPLIIMGLALVAFGALAYWGGLPPESELPKFMIGVAALLGVGLGIGALGWYLLYRPIAQPIPTTSALSVSRRQTLSLMLITAMMLQGIGGIWDEVWHTKYGVPFGEDFFWRPHLLMYIGFSTLLVTALVAWNTVLRSGKGTLTQRFRADPSVGLLVLMSLFFVYAIPADPLWHTIYGTDISAMSLPHVLLSLLTITALIAGVGLHRALVPVRAWRSILSLEMGDVLAVIAYTTILKFTLVLLGADWYGMTAAEVAAGNSPVFQRPDWLFPAFVVFVAVWAGTLANHTMRLYGAATLIGLAAVMVRLALVYLLDHVYKDANPWLLCLPPLIAVDLAIYFQSRRGQINPLWTGLAGGAAMVIGSLPLMNAVMRYPSLTAENAISMVLVVMLVALVAAWIGQMIGDMLSSSHKVRSEDHGYGRWAVPVLAATAIFIVVFIVTASPPV